MELLDCDDKIRTSFSADIMHVCYHPSTLAVCPPQPCMNKGKGWSGTLPGCEYQVLMWGVSKRGGWNEHQAQIWNKQQLPDLYHRCSNDNDFNQECIRESTQLSTYSSMETTFWLNDITFAVPIQSVTRCGHINNTIWWCVAGVTNWVVLYGW